MGLIRNAGASRSSSAASVAGFRADLAVGLSQLVGDAVQVQQIAGRLRNQADQPPRVRRGDLVWVDASPAGQARKRRRPAGGLSPAAPRAATTYPTRSDPSGP